MEESRPSNIEQELLAEIQVYRNKQQRWEASTGARRFKNWAMYFVFISSFIYMATILIWLIFPSTQPSFHAEISAFYAAAYFFTILLAWYESRTVLSEKKSIDNSSFEDYQSKVENDEKARGLLDRLKQNHEMYLQKLIEEYRTCIMRLVNLSIASVGIMGVGFTVYRVLEGTIFPILFSLICFFTPFVSSHVIAKLDDPDRKFIDWDFWRAAWRGEITREEWNRKMNEPIWPEKKKAY
ncbi:unnamed protein product [Caenorhabditis brenneri]